MKHTLSSLSSCLLLSLPLWNWQPFNFATASHPVARRDRGGDNFGQDAALSCPRGCHGNPRKVAICHHTGNNESPMEDICVLQSAVATHLTLHGDTCGPCQATASEPTITPQNNTSQAPPPANDPSIGLTPHCTILIPIAPPAQPPGATLLPIASPPLGSSGTTMKGRILASFGPTTCGFSVYPGSIGDQERYYEEIGPFFNPIQDPICVTVEIDIGTCVSSAGNTLIHTAAFSDFNPNDIGQHFLGDVGSRDDSFSFQFFVPPMTQFYIVGQQIRDIATQENGEGCVFSVTVRDDRCPRNRQR